MGFAFRKNREIRNILFSIRWTSPYFHYIMDTSAFEYEKEVLVLDGGTFQVLEIID